MHETIDTRNLVSAETAERNRNGDRPGGYTFNAPTPDTYEGRIVLYSVVRLGDHAHITVETGRQHANGEERPPDIHRSEAGRLVLRWEDWLHLRPALDAIPWVWIAEVEQPTTRQLERYVG